MNLIKVELVSKPDFDVLSFIGGLAKLTQFKKEFSPTTKETGKRIAKAIHTMGHTSLLECADFGFIVHGASRVFLAQITRHRVASYTSQSQQYQDQDNFPYVIPKSISDNPEALNEFISLMTLTNRVYKKLKILGIHKDDARYVIPGAACNDLYMKFNARELICAVIPQRICRRNTPESQYILRLMLQVLVDAGFKELFEIAGPACVITGKCDQGIMTCGRPFKTWEDMLNEDSV